MLTKDLSNATPDPVLDLYDSFGPEKVIYIHQPAVGLRGIVVIDNTAAGPSIGGVRLAEDVTLEECARLARAMTFKNAAAGLPHGGGKAVIVADPHAPIDKKENLIRAFADAIRYVEDYIVGPDMGTDESVMAWVKDEIGRCVGLPRALGGIPLDELGATGFGINVAVDVASRFCKLEVEGATVAIQGFGSVGRHAARYLAQRGARIVAVADSTGAVSAAQGLNVQALCDLKAEGKSVTESTPGTVLDREAIIDVECDIWIPAARPDVITVDNVERLRTRLVVQGANIPVTAAAERALHERGVLVVPDFIANAGGVICAAVEYAGGTESAAFATIEEKIRENTKQVLDAVFEQGWAPRRAANELSQARVRRAMDYRRWR